MCGIAGIISSDVDKLSRIPKMTDALIHRGPDHEGFYYDENVSLGMRRLSIVDLSGGNQPISNEDGSLLLICNGEIYNSPQLREELINRGHKFRTKSDVETILHLYEEEGENCAVRLRGMFAFAIWDKTQKSLFLCRDQIGQKPLYFYSGEGLFIFASEIKAILAAGLVDAGVDLNGLNHYVSLRYLPEELTFFKGIRKLEAATYLKLRNGEIKKRRYWSPDFTKKLTGDKNEILEELERVLLSSVESHLLSDVPVGSFLSGGIDSGIVTAMISKITKTKFPTFSIGVEEDQINEIPYARMLLKKYDLDFKDRIVKADIINLIPKMVYHMDEPSDPYGVGVYLVSKLASERVKVALGGDGGDENFAGYDRYNGNRLVDYYALLPNRLRKGFLDRLFHKVPDSYGYKSLAQKLLWLNEMSTAGGGERYAKSVSFLRFTREAKLKLFTNTALNRIDEFDSYLKIMKMYDADNAKDAVDKMLFTDLMTRMPDHLLMIADRMSMAHSLETRSPLIDLNVVEYAASMPADLKLNGNILKYGLKKVAQNYLPKELIYRKKQGFGFPIAMWLRKDLSAIMRSVFANSRFIELGLFDKKYVFELMNEHIEGKADHNFRLWILLNLEVWHRIFIENMTVEEIVEYFYSKKNRSLNFKEYSS